MARRTLAQSTLAQIRDVHVPPWWTAAQVGFGLIFAAAFFWVLISGTGDPAPHAGPAPGVQTSAPSAVAPSSPANDADATVKVPSADGIRQVDVPAAAYALAQQAYAAYHDPAAADGVATLDGAGFLSGDQPSKKAKVLEVLVSDSTAGEVTFLGLLDPDGGKGPKPSVYRTVTLVNEDDTWKVAAY